ncbi:hypothetical protein [Novosphingobium sp. Gsoil 351]|uniref:hypothetical protein n=1 Tax=Novosphingobium sp. Gsoil 351 TaxID=2675225 RepID=UPI001E452FC1|nr:hypothetical protein [Novosphingobium sp. Gsoil 351]
MRADQPPTRLSRRTPANRLLAALHDLGDGSGIVLRHEERRWASITFAGSRHALTLRFAGGDAVAAGERLIAALPEHEFAIPGRLIADATIVAVRHVLLPEPNMEIDCEVLMLDED